MKIPTTYVYDVSFFWHCFSISLQRFKATEFAHQWHWWAQVSWFWSGSGQVGPHPHIFPRSGHTVVQTTWCPHGFHTVLHSTGHVVRSEFLCVFGWIVLFCLCNKWAAELVARTHVTGSSPAQGQLLTALDILCCGNLAWIMCSIYIFSCTCIFVWVVSLSFLLLVYYTCVYPFSNWLEKITKLELRPGKLRTQLSWPSVYCSSMCLPTAGVWGVYLWRC